MNKKIGLLLEIQEYDVVISQCRRELNDIPLRIGEIRLKIKQDQERLKKTSASQKTEQADTHNIEVAIAAARDRAAKLKVQQFQIKTNAEYKALAKEIQGMNGEINALEDRALAKMEESEARQKDMERLARELDKENAIVEREAAELENRRAEIEKKMEEAIGKRTALAVGADPAWLAVYEKIFEHVKDRAIVSVADGVCGGCRLKTPPQLVHDAKKAERITSCNYCGRMLYCP